MVKQPLLETLTVSMFTNSMPRIINGMKFAANKLKTTNLWLRSLGNQIAQRLLQDLFSVQLMFTMFAWRSKSTYTYSNWPLFHNHRSSLKESKMVNSSFWNPLKAMKLQILMYTKTDILSLQREPLFFLEIWSHANSLRSPGDEVEMKSLTFLTLKSESSSNLERLSLLNMEITELLAFAELKALILTWSLPTSTMMNRNLKIF